MIATKKILRYTLGVLLTVFFCVIILFQLPSFQTFIAEIAVEKLGAKIDGKVEIEKVHLRFINTIVIKGLCITDTNPPREYVYDTLIRAESISVRFSLLSLLTHDCVSLKRVTIKNARFNLVTDLENEYKSNIARIFKLPQKDTLKEMTTKPLLHIDKIVVENMGYGMRNYSNPSKIQHPWNVDWTDVDVTEINLMASDFNIRDAHFTGKMNEFSFKEKSGWNVLEMSCNFSVGQGTVDLSNVHFRDSFGSEMFFDYKMFGRINVYKDYVNQVRMDGVFKNCSVCLSSLARVIPPMYEDSTTFATLTGHAYGPVADLHGDTLKLGFRDNCVRATVNTRVSALPNVHDMRIDSHISDINFTTEDLTKILRAIVQKKNIDLSKLGKGSKYTGKVVTEGLLNNLKAEIELDQFNLNQSKGSDNCGRIGMNLKMENVLEKGLVPMTVNGKVISDSFDLDALVSPAHIQNVTMSASVGVRIPGKGGGLRASVDSLNLKNIEYNGCSYKNISGFACLLGKDVDAQIQVRDSALNAEMNIWTGPDKYQAKVYVKAADLHRMNFSKRQISIVHGRLEAEMDKDLKHPQGVGKLSEIRLYNDTGAHSVDDVCISAALDTNMQYDINVESGLTDGGFRGTKEEFTAYMTFGETLELLNFIQPGLYAEKGTSISARKDSTGCYYGTIESGRLALNKNYVKNLSASVCGPADSLEARICSDDIAAAGFHFGNNCIDASLVRGLLSLNYEYSGMDNGHLSEGQINGSALFNKDKSLKININPSYIINGEDKWEISESSLWKKDKDISIENLSICCGNQHLILDGGISENSVDTLYASVKNLDVSEFNLLTKKDFDFHGRLNAEGRIISPRNAGMDVLADLPRMEVKLDADSLKIKGRDYGHIQALSVYEHDMERFRVDIAEEIADHQALTGKLYFVPSTKDMTINAKLDKFPFGFLSAFTEGIFNDLDGQATADVSITRTNGLLNLYCKEGRIDNGMIEIAFTHVPYYLNGTFDMDNSGIHFKKMQVHDRDKGTATASGGVKWDRLKDIKMDMHLSVKDIEALNIPSNIQGNMFYGNVIASGNVALTGPFTSLLLWADAKTTGPSNMHFVVSDDMDATKGELLSFTDPFIKDIDPYVKMMQKQNEAEKSQSGMSLKIRAEADQNFKANLDMNGTGFAAGAAGVGKGVVNIDIDSRQKSFSILGDYRLQEGIFDFNASDIVHRQFAIRDGSMVKFCGSIPQTELNVLAEYETKASIAPLISDTTSVSNRRLIQCGISIKNKLTDPSISFSIKIPDLDPSVQASVESALNSEAKIQRQFLSVLVSNNFLPDEQSGIVNNASILYSNVSALMATQINNIFAKLDIPVDLGLNYQPSDKGGASLFDVAVSTQLWNNRVIIGGSLGNRQSTNSTNGTIFGDLDIEYKVTKNGALRLKAFSHAADQYSNYLDQSQRNGIGATWQQEFDNFCTWCKFLFMKKDDKLKFQEEQINKSKQTKKLILDE